ncbi:hypothetical protein ACNR9Q_06155 [Maribacter sp. X9]|uniref:hypothetical protein n=1 Tax=Maribacter sp. X9 TaxID=3402159 RepID=UPI003AF3E983
MQKIVKIALIVIGLIGAVLWFMLPPKDMPAAEAAQNGAMNAMFIITYILLGFAIVASVLFALKNLFANPAGLKKTLFVLVGFAIVAVISYVISSGTDVSPEYMAMSNESTVKYIGMGLYIFFILTFVAVILMIVPGVKKLFGK